VPAANSFGGPTPQPNETYPDGAYNWNPKYGVGAGPVLLKKNISSDMFGIEEVFGDSLTRTKNPRTAICRDFEGKIIFFVADGRSEYSSGLFINETAAIMKSIGCQDAINLDGGGSSCLIS